MGFRSKIARMALGKLEARVGPLRIAHRAFDSGNYLHAIEYGDRAIAQLEGREPDDDGITALGSDKDLAEARVLVGLAYKRIDDAGRSVPLLRAVYDSGAVDATIFDGNLVRANLALAEMQAGSYARINPLLDDIARRGPGSKVAFAHRVRAMIVWRTTADLGAASAELERSVIADPPNEPGLFWHDAVYRAGFLADTGRYEEAKKFAAPAIEQQQRAVDPSQPGQLTDLGVTMGQYGRILTHLGELDEAHHYITQGLQLLDAEKRYALTYSYLGQSLWFTKSGQLDEADRTFDAGWTLANEIGIIPTAIELLVCRLETDRARRDDRAFDQHRAQALDLCRMLGHVAEQRHIESL